MQTEPREIASSVAGVAVLERTFKSKANSDQVTQRLYQYGDGVALAAIRGGAMTLSDGSTWEIVVMRGGIAQGESAGNVTDEQLTLAVERLAAWVEKRSAA
jgi:hypothetical protein